MQLEEIAVMKRTLSRKRKQYEDALESMRIAGSIRSDLTEGAYTFCVVDDSLRMPYRISRDVLGLARRLTRGINQEGDKAEAIYNWFVENITYDHEKLAFSVPGYRDSLAVLENSTGICGEMAFLYIVMARCAGLESYFVHVRTDCFGKDVRHGCAGVATGSGEILADPAYRKFNAKHIDYTPMPDRMMIKLFEEWNRQP